MQNHNYVPAWLEAIMSESDRAIVYHRDARFLAEDADGNRLPNDQQWIESPVGSMWIDSTRRAILGYGEPVETRMPHEKLPAAETAVASKPRLR